MAFRSITFSACITWWSAIVAQSIHKIIEAFICYCGLIVQLFYRLCNNCKPLGMACVKCDTFKGCTEKVRVRLALVKA